VSGLLLNQQILPLKVSTIALLLLKLVQIRIAVSAAGELLLNGEPASLAPIEAALEAADPKKDFVLYYRENPQASAPAQAMQVLNLIRSHRFAISFSTQPDFSDYVDSFGQSHPRRTDAWPHPTDPFAPWMPDVDLGIDPQKTFDEVCASPSQGVVIVRPDRASLLLQNSPSSPRIQELLRGLPPFVPRDEPHNIAAIANTAFTMLQHAVTPGLAEASRAIPFLGLLMGCAQAGNRVWIFEGHSSAIAAGLTGVDLLFVDSGMLPHLQANWMTIARQAMNLGGTVYHYNRENRQMLPIAPSSQPPGWRFNEPDGEASYANCLLTLLAMSPAESVEIETGSAVPNLKELASNDIEREWVAGLPFRYEVLDARKVIEILLNASTDGVLRTTVVSSDRKPKIQSFLFRRDGPRLKIDKLQPPVSSLTITAVALTLIHKSIPATSRTAIGNSGAL